MAGLPGFVDAIPGSVTRDGAVYVSQVLLHINADAYALRFDPETIAAAQADADAAEAEAVGTEPGDAAEGEGD